MRHYNRLNALKSSGAKPSRSAFLKVGPWYGALLVLVGLLAGSYITSSASALDGEIGRAHV